MFELIAIAILFVIVAVLALVAVNQHREMTQLQYSINDLFDAYNDLSRRVNKSEEIKTKP